MSLNAVPLMVGADVNRTGIDGASTKPGAFLRPLLRGDADRPQRAEPEARSQPRPVQVSMNCVASTAAIRSGIFRKPAPQNPQSGQDCE